MSLTSFISQKDVRAKFREVFAKPSDCAMIMKTSRLLYPVSPPLTTNYGLVGTAFDYLMRFQLERLNPNSRTYEWVAETVSSMTWLNVRIKTHACETIKRARANLRKFRNTGECHGALMKSALLLAQLDVIYRAGKVPDDLGRVRKKDLQDLRNLVGLLDLRRFTAQEVCVLNPTFGLASSLVGGADADIVIDDMLIDIKTTKEMELTRQTFNQLIGYYVLYSIGGIEGLPSRHSINYLGVYFSRFGYLYKMHVSEVIDQKVFPKFCRWFERRAAPGCEMLYRACRAGRTALGLVTDETVQFGVSGEDNGTLGASPDAVRSSGPSVTPVASRMQRVPSSVGESTGSGTPRPDG